MKFKPMTSKELNEFGQTFATGFAAGIEKSKRGMEMKVRLADLEPGKLFRFGDTIGFKTEYRTGGAIEAFIVGSGEMFWGGTSTAQEQRELMVEPIDLKDLV
ncbi:hypothetical protein [Bacillus toyonensis]|uniref:hypothetical protein n=1 Tax=Bacillus toyonensis TaxID=155322 RepID=UPI000BEBD295|nr:hypothetical protein [Bacillus toyonensis]PEC65338.1 hypothetical protein CON62_22300 [Bacillus toyonensis]